MISRGLTQVLLAVALILLFLTLFLTRPVSQRKEETVLGVQSLNDQLKETLDDLETME